MLMGTCFVVVFVVVVVVDVFDVVGVGVVVGWVVVVAGILFLIICSCIFLK